MGVSRRTFFKASVIPVSFFGVYGVFKYFTAKPEDVVVSILQRRLGYLSLGQDDLRNFSMTYVKRKAQHKKKLTLLSVIADPLRFISPYQFLPAGHTFRRMEDNVVSLFLLSTDFFQNDADENRSIAYLGYYDPLIAICRNPLMQRV